MALRLYQIIILFCVSCPLWGQVDKVDFSIKVKEAEYLEHFADSCLNMGDTESALSVLSKSLSIRKSIQGTDNADFARTLLLISSCYSLLGDNVKAIKYGTEAMVIRKALYGPEHPDYAVSINYLAVYNDKMGNFAEAIRLGTMAMEIQRKVLGNNHIDYSTTLSYLARFHSHLRNYTEAIKIGHEALEIRKRQKVRDLFYGSLLNDLARYNSALGDYTEAIRFGTEALMIVKKEYGPNSPNYATSLNNLAIYNSILGNYAEAIMLGMEALKIRKKRLGTMHSDYVTSLEFLSQYYYNLGNYSEAIRLREEAMNILKRQPNTNHLNYASTLSNLSSYYLNSGNYIEAFKFGTEALEIRKKSLGTEHPDYAYSLSNLALCYFYLGNYSEAIKREEEAIDVQRKVLGPTHPDYITSLLRLGVINSKIKNYSETIRLMTEAMEIKKGIKEDKDLEYATALDYLARCNAYLGFYSEAIRYEMEKIDFCSSFAIEKLSKLSYRRRQFYWNSSIKKFFDSFLSFAFQLPHHNFNTLLYDKSALLGKGILLNTEVEMKKIILESKDSTLIKEYHKYLSYNEIYNKQVSLPVAERCVNVDSLKMETQKIEDYLTENTYCHGDVTRNIQLTWRDVQQQLENNDIAIEFVNFTASENREMYAALTIGKDYERPHLIVLFEEKQLKSVSDTLYYQCKDMTDLVWKPMKSELEGAKNIYFSPSGVLYDIGIEYLPGMENYNIFRLSSTRELVTNKTTGADNKAVLYGGLDYYANLDTMPTNKLLKNEDDIYIEHANVRGIKLRGGKELLPETKIEVEKIGKELKSSQWDYSILTDKAGTEESFKSLSGKKIKTLHLSTHGFYYTPEEADSIGYDFLQIDNRIASAEDKALTRSGLIMSGANHILEGEELPKNVEDGILTAKEIADVDLRGLDLVVLSACQTGLGDIAQGEGVFGLQRGFKKAGANSILMSLWEVDDKATQILMTQFYRNLLSGQSKRQSLLNAQKNLREYRNANGEQCYNSPKYWAAFILLDGFDKKLEDN